VRNLPFFPSGGGSSITPTDSGGGGGGSTSSGPTVEFQGKISAVAASSLVVSGKTIIITPTTKVNVSGGTFKVGQQAQGKGQQQSNGDIIATSIQAE